MIGLCMLKMPDLRWLILKDCRLDARLAQWIEHRFPKAVVAGSIPAAGAFFFVRVKLTFAHDA